MRIFQSLLLIILGLLPSCTSSQESPTYDIVIYGGTSSAVAAAIQAKRMGKSVVIVCPETHLGGLSAGGLGWTDSGNKAAVGGISREFYQRVKHHYDDPTAWQWQKPEEYSRYRPDDDSMWVFEPHVAEAIFEQLVAEYNIPVFRDHWIQRSESGNSHGVTKVGTAITAIRTINGDEFRGTMFIDATYEGDLMAAAGISYTVGRESNKTYSETLNGVQKANAKSHQFNVRVSPYIIPGDSASGLLPRIHADDPGDDGAGDSRIQAYNYRVCLTRVTENRVPFTMPDGYDPSQYELLLRYLNTGSRHVFGKFDPAPNNKTDTNNHGAFSTDNIGMNYDYPEATYERRKAILKEHEVYQRGYFYFLANDPRVPEDVRTQMSAWGMSRDEFVDNEHWPHQIYVREARRMVSDFVMTERHLRGLESTPKPIGMGSYNMDSHNTQRYVAHDKDGVAYVRNEGDIQVNPGGPYQISYDAIIPSESQCINLLVPVCLSSSHIAYGSIRMEPVFMILGQSAATAASIAIEARVPVQRVKYKHLKERLVEDGQVLELERILPKIGLDPRAMGGIVIDDAQAAPTGPWSSSASVTPFVGSSYLHDNQERDQEMQVRFKVAIKESGRYEIRLSYSPHPNRATNVRVTIETSDELQTASVNQRLSPPIDGLWITVATIDARVGQTVTITVSNRHADGYVIVDAVQVLPVVARAVEPG